jgi:putative SOS response-associated peptidase YedK
MCGRFALPVPRAVLQERFGLEPPESYHPRHNIAPGQDVLALVPGELPVFRTLRWGLVPPWAGRGRGPGLLVNIRSETAWTKTWFRDLTRARRCLIPAAAFYEWMAAPGGGRIPHALALADRSVFGLAGLWAGPGDGGEREEAQCAVLTTAANALVSRVHGRMPVMLGPEQGRRWLDPGLGREAFLALVRPCPARDMVLWPVSTLVNAPGQDEPDCLEPVASAQPGYLPLG